MLYGRKITVDIENVDKVLSYPELEITFNGKMDTDPSPDIFEIRIYNLSNGRINSIKKDAQINLNAGYGDDIGLIFTGVIQRAETITEEASLITLIKVQTGNKNWVAGTISKTYNGQVKASKILADLIPSLGLEAGYIDLVNDVTYKNGKTVFGKIKDVVKQIANECDTPIIIKDGKINFINENTRFQTAYILKSSTGLITSPSKVDDEKADYQVKCLLNNNLTIKSLIKLESKYITGNFEVVEALFNDDFTQELKLKEV